MILQSPGPIQFVVSDDDDGLSLRAAIRLAHSLDVYHKLDVSIVEAHEAVSLLATGTLGSGNIVIVGGRNNTFLKSMLPAASTPFSLDSQGLSLNGRQLRNGSAALFLHPHPASSSALALVIYADAQPALERALRLFPIRTGITVPDWIVVDDTADQFGAGGVQAAGSVLEQQLSIAL